MPSSEPSSVPPPPPSIQADCPDELLIDIDPRVADTTVSGRVTVGPLQEPAFPDPVVLPPGATVPDPNPDPSTWDHSEVPAGACVFRLWGVDASCYPSGGEFFTSSCAAVSAAVSASRPLIAPGSFYDGMSRCGVMPGCPSAEPYEGEPGYWWYFGESGVVFDGEAFTDIVICAPECANSFAMGGCLRLRPNSSRCD